MSSMADILFILMMFFMMTSALTAPSALALLLPGRSAANEKMVDQSKLPHIDITNDGLLLLNGKTSDTTAIRTAVERITKSVSDPSKINIVVSPESNSLIEDAVPVLDIITQAGANVVLDLVD